MMTDNDHSGEKRAAFRYPVILPVDFENGTGWTRDVSTSGAYIETDRPFEFGAAIRFFLYQHSPDEDTRLQCHGVVVRTEQRGDRWRIAVFMEFFRFEM